VVRTDQVNVILIDADVENAACKDSLALFEAYRNHRQMLQNTGPSGTAFHCDIHMLTAAAISPVQKEAAHLEQVAAGNDVRKRALKWFYTEEELGQDLSKGFYAHPNIGCVFFQNFSNPQIDLFMQRIIDDLKGGSEPSVAIVGSVFGGTGAAGIPSVLKMLKERCAAEEVRFDRLSCCGVLITPYFKVAPAPGGSERKSGKLTINSDDFYGSTKAALPYYRFNDDFKRTYLVGQKTLETVNDQYADGGEEQKNKPHIVEVLAALAIKDFLERSRTSKQVFGWFVNRGDEKITWDSLGKEMYGIADMVRAQMVLETEVYPNAVSRPEGHGGYQWRRVYHINSAASQQQLKVMQDYSKFFLEWLYGLQSQYIGGSSQLCADPATQLCDPDILGRLLEYASVKRDADGAEYRMKGGWRQYQQDFINLIETAEKIEFVVKKIGVLISALGVLTKPSAVLNGAGLFLKLFSLTGHTNTSAVG